MPNIPGVNILGHDLDADFHGGTAGIVYRGEERLTFAAKRAGRFSLRKTRTELRKDSSSTLKLVSMCGYQ
jgi:hypothetical protein